MPQPDRPERTTHFGFREVPESAKDELVAGVFHSVANKYAGRQLQRLELGLCFAQGL